MSDPIADSPEHAELHATVRRVIADVSPPERVAELDEAEVFDNELHRALASLDVLRLGLDVGDVRDQLVAIEELGAGPTSMAAFLISHYAAVGAGVRTRRSQRPRRRRVGRGGANQLRPVRAQRWHRRGEGDADKGRAGGRWVAGDGHEAVDVGCAGGGRHRRVRSDLAHRAVASGRHHDVPGAAGPRRGCRCERCGRSESMGCRRARCNSRTCRRRCSVRWTAGCGPRSRRSAAKGCTRRPRASVPGGVRSTSPSRTAKERLVFGRPIGAFQCRSIGWSTGRWRSRQRAACCGVRRRSTSAAVTRRRWQRWRSSPRATRR